MSGILETIQNIREQLNDIEKQFTTIRDSVNSMARAEMGKKRGPKPKGGEVARYQAAHTDKPKRKMSAAGRARIAAAQKARWAKLKAGK